MCIVNQYFMKKLLYGATSGEYIENTIHITVDKKISLLDPRNGMLPRDLLQLYFAVESYFGIKFEERNVIDERFDYLCNMVDAIQEKLKKIRTEINTYE